MTTQHPKEAEVRFTPCPTCSNPVSRSNWHLPYCSGYCKEHYRKEPADVQLTDRGALDILGRILLGLGETCHNFNPHTLFSRAEQLINQQKCVVDNKEDLKCDTDKPSTLPEPITIVIKSKITIHIP